MKCGKWLTQPLGQICHTSSGGTPSRSKSEYFGGGIPWVKSGDLTDGDVTTSEETITEEALSQSSAKLFRKGTVLIAMYGATVGKLGLLGIDATTNQAVCGITPSDEIDRIFLFYYLLSQRSALIEKSTGGAQPNISQKIIKELSVPVPPIVEQQSIVDILTRADGIVRLRREAKKKADDLIPALFLDMFGDPATNPKGWPVAMLPDVLACPFKNGLYLPKEKYATDSSSDGVEMVHMSDAFYGEVKRGGLRRVLADEKQIRDYRLSKNDLLVARRSLTYDGAAKICGIPASGEPLLFESSFIRLIPDSGKVRTEYLLYYLNNENTRRAHVLSRISGITISGINQAAMNQIPVMLPPLTKQGYFVERVSEVRSIQFQQSVATAKAQATFEALLSKVFSN